MQSLARRVADGQVLSVIKAWLNAPVIEKTEHGDRRTPDLVGPRLLT
jgi:hypothetical protein